MGKANFIYLFIFHRNMNSIASTLPKNRLLELVISHCKTQIHSHSFLTNTLKDSLLCTHYCTPLVRLPLGLPLGLSGECLLCYACRGGYSIKLSTTEFAIILV